MDTYAAIEAQDQKQLITNLLDAWNAHDVDRIVAFYAPDSTSIDVARAQPMHGRAGLRRSLERYLAAFPDVHVTADQLIIDRDGMALSWQAVGTHRGHFIRIPPTGHPVTMRGVTLIKVHDGQISYSYRMWDVAGLLRAMHLLPEL